MSAETDYSLSFELKGGMVHARVESSEAGSREHRRSYLEKIADHCFQCQCGSVLIERHLPDPFAVWDAFQIGPKLALIGHEQIMVAIVELVAEPMPKRDLTIVLGKERWLSIQIFSNIKKAEQWLSAGFQRPSPGVAV